MKNQKRFNKKRIKKTSKSWQSNEDRLFQLMQMEKIYETEIKKLETALSRSKNEQKIKIINQNWQNVVIKLSKIKEEIKLAIDKVSLLDAISILCAVNSRYLTIIYL